MKIVLAGDEDKQTIVKKTGQSAYFAIYEDDRLVEFVPNKHHDGGHHTHTHTQSEKNTTKHGITADEVVKNFLSGNI